VLIFYLIEGGRKRHQRQPRPLGHRPDGVGGVHLRRVGSPALSTS